MKPYQFDSAKVAKIVFEILAKDFKNVEIVDVTVTPDCDIDDEIVLRIEVVFKGRSRDVDARSVSGAVRHVRPQLKSIGEFAFPLFSFITQSEASGRLASA